MTPQPLEELAKYEKFNKSIKNIDKIIEKVAYVVNMNNYVGNIPIVRLKRQELTKTTIDLIETTNELIRSNDPLIRKKTLDSAEKNYGINKQYTNYFLFKLDNEIYVIGNIIIKKKILVDWKLHSETKKIQDFVCYKATAVIEIINSVGIFKRNVVAWYCPKIPVSFGPKGYGGLPGLILEFEEKNITFGAKKITLNPTNIIIEKPSKYKRVSEIEYEKMVDKSMQTITD